MLFTFVAIGLAAVIAAMLTLTLMRGRSGDEPPAAYDLRVYRDQLREVEKDLARGVITADEAGRIRTEVSRRVLDADRALKDQHGGAQAPRGASLVAGAALLAVLLGGTWGVYRTTGSPGYPDQPFKARVDEAAEFRETRMRQAQAEAEAPPIPMPAPDPEHLKLVDRLREVVAERNDDLRGYLLLARNEAALGNFQAAYAAQSRAIELKQGRATAEDYATKADMMVLAAAGYVSPEAEDVLEDALNRDPRNGTALYYWGLMHIQTGRPDIAFRVWRELLSVSKAGDPWLEQVNKEIRDLAWYAGEDDYTPPPLPEGEALRGPSAEDMEAAAEMSPEQRQEMIRNMVANLSDRLARQGGSPEEWAQLIRALGILGDRTQAGAIWTEAQQVFAPSPEALETVRAAAVAAGVTE
ncbi:c-type cytochrome biogenesis protein CcmI [Rhodovulum euryhalinum]|uniref:Cytochrome c-type biogenesis protein CcmH n=1 Tax=Rhodovulum euryhalinum TaxID=35805 RepID=A0A4R2KCH1_9RHOB|nr:c-type cytochrome biogenesis protein CcmI [Rhodovulum euryhalinum]TCO69797.1 cytochrome c-type biogenesis protein CcmH [Rhodovulum euryhalinum]